MRARQSTTGGPDKTAAAFLAPTGPALCIGLSDLTVGRQDFTQSLQNGD
jgi:hypothetical protein